MGKQLNFTDPQSTGWRFETSGLDRAEVYEDRAVLSVGGFESFTHYSRAKEYEFPVELDTPFTLDATIELADDFYTQQTDYFRLLGVDNYPVALNGNTWRIGLVIHSDHQPRLVLQHRFVGPDETIIWEGGARLPLGIHTYALAVRASETDPLTELYIDGVKVASSTMPNVPQGLQASEKTLWRQVVGIDGASGYGERETLALVLRSASVYSGFPKQSGCLGALMDLMR